MKIVNLIKILGLNLLCWIIFTYLISFLICFVVGFAKSEHACKQDWTRIDYIIPSGKLACYLNTTTDITWEEATSYEKL